MTKDEMRVAIGADQGWRQLEAYSHWSGRWVDGNPNPIETGDIPNYPDDLNAIRQAVLSQKDKFGFMEFFNSHLMTIVQRDYGAHLASLPLTFYMTMASAEQFSEAYCRTRGLLTP